MRLPTVTITRADLRFSPYIPPRGSAESRCGPADYPSPRLRIRSSTDSFVPESINLCRGSLAVPVDALGQFRGQRGDFEPHLLGRVAVAQCYRVVFHRLMIDRDAERRAHFVLPTIAPPDRTGLIVGGRKMALEHAQHLMRLL